MPTRHLTDDQRQEFARFSGEPSPADLARFFHLDEADRVAIGELRGHHNRLGFALLLCSARFLGSFPGSPDQVPAVVLGTLRLQLDIAHEIDLAGYFAGQACERHAVLIRRRFGFSDFGDNAAARFGLTRWLYALCWSGEDRAGLLIEQAAAWLIAGKVLLPGVTVLERLIGRIRERAQVRLWRCLVAGLDNEQRARIARLFNSHDTAAFNALDALRTVPAKRAPRELLRQLDLLDAVRTFDLRPVPPRGVPPAALERLARVARVSKPSAIAALREPRRTATVAALFYTLEAAAQDDAAELAEALLADLVRDAEAAHKQGRLRTLRDLDEAAALLNQLAQLVMTADDLPLDTWRDTVFQRLPRERIEDAMAKVEALARTADASLHFSSSRRILAGLGTFSGDFD